MRPLPSTDPRGSRAMHERVRDEGEEMGGVTLIHFTSDRFITRMCTNAPAWIKSGSYSTRPGLIRILAEKSSEIRTENGGMYNIPRSRDWILLLRRAFLLLSRTPGTNSLKSRRPSLTRGKMLIIARSNLPSLLFHPPALSLFLSHFPSSREQTRYFENATFTRCCYSFTLRWTRVVARNSDYSEDKIETRGERMSHFRRTESHISIDWRATKRVENKKTSL